MDKLNSLNHSDISFKDLVISIKQFLHYLLKRWYLFLILIIVGYSIGYFWESTKPTMYTATTTFILEGDGGGGKSLAGLGALLGGDFGGGASQSLFQGQSLLELYKSNAILKEVLLSTLIDNDNTLLIQELFLINEDLSEKISESNKLLLTNIEFLKNPNPDQLRQRDSILQGAVKVIKDNYFSVEYPNARASLIQVDVNAESEVFAKSFNHYLVSKVNDLYMEIKSGKSYENVKVLQRKVDSVRHVMLGAVSRVALLQDQTPNLNPTRGALRNVPTQDAQMTVEATKGVYAEFNRNLEMAKLSLSKDVPLIKIIDEATYPLNKNVPNKNKKGIIVAFGFFFLTIAFMSMLYVYRQLMKED